MFIPGSAENHDRLHMKNQYFHFPDDRLWCNEIKYFAKVIWTKTNSAMTQSSGIFPLGHTIRDSEIKAMFLAQTVTLLGRVPNWNSHAIIFY